MYGQYGTYPPKRTLFSDDNSSSYTVPDDAFVAPPHYEGTILLETAIDDPEVVAHGDLIDAWAELSAYSVEAALAGRPDVFDFANNHCLLFAAIRSPIRLPIPPDLMPTDAVFKQCVIDFNLPNHHTVFHAVSPVLPADPDAVYAMVKDAHELDLSIRGEKESPSRYQSIPTPSPDPGTDTKAADDDSKPPTDVLMQWRTVGIVYVTMSTTPREVHIGVGLLPDFRGYGGAMTASAFAVQWAVETIQAHRVQARILASPHRERAQRLFTALGFAHEGLQRRTVTDAAGEWADVTHMGVLDTDWVVRKRRRAAPRSMWDDLFERHQREREELLRWDETRERMRLRRTSSMETVRMSADAEPAGEEELFEPYQDDDASSSQAASRLPSIEPPSSSSPSSSCFTTPSIESDYEEERGLLRSPGSQAGDPFSDTEWVLPSGHSDVSGSSDSEELISRPESPEGW